MVGGVVMAQPLHTTCAHPAALVHSAACALPCSLPPRLPSLPLPLHIALWAHVPAQTPQCFPCTMITNGVGLLQTTQGV